ncbi:MAG: ATP-binding protein [Bryobacterales bacterium]|nr:ATP-binding protein [Bryobacterales bacterium]
MTCSKCQDTGWIQEQLPSGFTASKRCTSCRQNGPDASKYGPLRLPPRFAAATFEDLSAGHYLQETKKHQILTRAMSMGREFAADFPAASCKGLLFQGGTMERRTHLAVATLKRLADRGFSCLFVDYQNLLDILQARSGESSEDREREDIASLVNSVDVLMIESLGDRRATDWGVDTIYAIIKHRYYHTQAGLLATTGLPFGPRASQIRQGTQGPVYRDTLEQRIGGQSAEMLGSICATVPVTVPDL